MLKGEMAEREYCECKGGNVERVEDVVEMMALPTVQVTAVLSVGCGGQGEKVILRLKNRLL
jgi:hypothetical protein